jgi:hypothetical protein
MAMRVTRNNTNRPLNIRKKDKKRGRIKNPASFLN